MTSNPSPRRRSVAGWTLAELMTAMTISSLLCAGVITGAIMLQRSFMASRHHIQAQAEQMRLMDYMNLDLRRALTVSTDFGRLTLTIPNYYDSIGKPRDPEIRNGLAVYGTTPPKVIYYQQGSTIYRLQGATLTPLATNVADFQLTFQDLGQSIAVSVSFLPKYQFYRVASASIRDGTATYSTTLLRNKRQN